MRRKPETSLVVMTNGAVKSIPLSSMTSEMWRSMFSGDAPAGSPAAFYETVPWLYAGVNLIANAVGSLPVRWTNDRGEPVDAGRMAAWTQSFGDLLNALAGDLTMYGAAYIFRGNNRRGVPTEMRRLLPTTMTPEIDAVNGLTGFTRTVNGQRLKLDLSEVVYIWEPNRTGETGPGKPRAMTALAAAGALASIDASTVSLFTSGAMRPTIAFFKDTMRDEEIEKAESTIKRRLQGVKNAFGFAAVSGEVSFATLGDKPSDLVMPELTNSKRQDVATALGVPQTLMFSDAANYATAQQDALNFYDLTVIPMAQRILSAINSQLLDEVGLLVETAENELELYQRMQADQVASLSTMFGQRVITVNEFRERVGFAPLEDGLEIDTDSDTDASPLDEPPQHADETPDQLPEPEDNPSDQQQRDEMRQWRNFALKRVREGKRGGRTFRAVHIPPTLAAALEGQLDAAEDVSAVRAAFDHAERWIGYP